MPSCSVRRQHIQQFKDICPAASDNIATHVLQQCAWKLDEAINHFYDNRHSYQETIGIKYMEKMSTPRRSTLDFTKILRATQQTRDAVAGFIRMIQEELSPDVYKHATPPLIDHICLCFYHLNDEWDTECIAECLELSGNTLTHTHSLKQGSAFLSNVASKGQHHWTFKMGHCHNWTLIGLWKIRNPINLETYFSSGGEKSGYAYISSDGKLASLESGDWGGSPREYGKFKPTEGDIVEMCVDFDTLQIRYIVNGIDFGVAFDNIERTEYRAAVNMYYSQDSITLIED